MWCDVTWSDTVWLYVTRRDVMWCGVKWHHAMWWYMWHDVRDVMWSGMMWRYVMQCDVMWCHMMCCAVTWYVTRCHVIRYDVTWSDVTWSVVVWCDVKSKNRGTPVQAVPVCRIATNRIIMVFPWRNIIEHTFRAMCPKTIFSPGLKKP
jgi:hypothetical protein